jgi:hemerythrin
LLEIVRYPDRAGHCDLHARLIDQVARLEDQLKNKPAGEDLVGFFEDWFVRHVLASDRDYAAYVSREFPALSGAPSA